MDSLQKYIESLTKTDSSQDLENVKQFSVFKNKNVSQLYKKNLPHNLVSILNFFFPNNYSTRLVKTLYEL